MAKKFKIDALPIKWDRISQPYKQKSHRGIDLAAPIGRPVYAAAAGTVVASSFGSWDKSYGYHVAIYHGGGNYTNYAHLSKIKTHIGKKVKAGEVIGLCGSTGNSTGPHLHFEIHKGRKWNRVNPKPYIDDLKARKKAKPKTALEKGGSYTLLVDLNVRAAAGKDKPLVGVKHWTASAQKHATKNGLLAKGTKVTINDIMKLGNSTWVRIPSGWICAGTANKKNLK